MTDGAPEQPSRPKSQPGKREDGFPGPAVPLPNDHQSLAVSEAGIDIINLVAGLADLSPDKRALLELLLQEQGLSLEDLVGQLEETSAKAQPDRAGIQFASIPHLIRESGDLTTYRFPLSFAQQRLWFLDQWSPGSPLYNIPTALRLIGPLSIPALERSLNVLICRHETLRTTFIEDKGQPSQIIAPQLTLCVPVIDLQHLPSTNREIEVLRLVAEEASKPFNLSTGPLLRVVLFRLNPNDHLIVLTMHHIVADGWSMGVLTNEMALLYQAYSSAEKQGSQPDMSTIMPELPVQYADYAAWQQGWLKGEVLEEQLAYWKQKLSGIQSLINLPTDRPRPATITYRGAYCNFHLLSELSQSLSNLAHQEDTTLFMVLLAAFQVLLYRYTNQDDICVGTPVANRNRSEIEGLIGFFVNTLVLRGDLSGEPGFRDFLKRIRETTLDAIAHQDIPFEVVVDAVQPERDLSHPPLFQVMFSLVKDPPKSRTLPVSGLTLTPIEAHSGTAKFDLTLVMNEGSHGTTVSPGIGGMLEYNLSLFEPATIERLLGSFQVLLAGIIHNPDESIATLPILSESERKTLLIDWNSTSQEYPYQYCVHQLIEQQVEIHPDRIAAVFDGMVYEEDAVDQQLTYRELNRRANQLGHYLRKLGVGPETLVGICIERSIEMLVAVLGVWKAGGAYLPLDPAFPKDRLEYMLDDAAGYGLAGKLLVLTNEALKNKLTINPQQLICLDSGWLSISQESEAQVVSQVAPQNLSYVIYTSGSTGKPKGILIHHLGLTNFVTNYARVLTPMSGCRTLQFASFNFDAWHGEVMTTLTSGGTIYLTQRETILSPETLHEFIQKHRLTSALISPAMLRLLSEDNLPDLQYVMSGGDVCSLEIAVRWAPGRNFYNGYGPTEVTVGQTAYEVKQIPDGVSSVPIGRPLANLRAYIIDSHRQPAPIGVHGEILLGGAGVARGYINQPELTAEKFIPDPFAQLTRIEAVASPFPQPMMYRTGDLGRFLPDGTIECLGRVDQQVKVRGFRIEIGEIEAVIREMPGVQDTVVIVRDEQRLDGSGRTISTGDKQLIAYLTVKKSMDLSIAGMRAFLRDHIPEYMIPSILMILEEIPLLPTGKINRQALPEPGLDRSDFGVTYVAPRSPQEEIIANILAQILGLDEVGIFDNFFELGGHSLLATKVISRLKEAFQVDVPLRLIFEAPTVVELAEKMNGLQNQALGVWSGPITKLPRQEGNGLPVGEIPLSFAQQRLWFLDQFEPGSTYYNIPSVVRLSGVLNESALEQSLNEIVRRHEILRTTITTIEGRAIQVIAPEHRIALPVIDLRHLSWQEREAEARRLISIETNRTFQLDQGPLLRAVLIRMGNSELLFRDHLETTSFNGKVDIQSEANLPQWLFVLTIHHIISDGWSMGVFIREIAALYPALAGEITVKDIALPELPIQYSDYAAWQRNWFQGEVLENQLLYWKKQLHRLPPLLSLPTDWPRPAVMTTRGALKFFKLPPVLLNSLDALCHQEGVTLFMILLAAFQILLYRYTRQEDIFVGTPIANRNRAEIESLIGFFVNTLVLRTDLTGNPSFRELLKRVREVALGAYAHQDIPFEMLVNELQPERNTSHTPLFQVMFVLQNLPKTELTLPELKLASVDVEKQVSEFDLTLTIIADHKNTGEVSSFEGMFEFNTDLFDAGTIERMIGHFQVLLKGVIDRPDMHLSELPLLTPSEWEKIIVEWNHSRIPDAGNLATPDRLIHQLIEIQADLNPDAVALVMAHPHQQAAEKLPYRDLNQRANHLAHLLVELGVGPEIIIGLCLDRSLDMIVGMLAVMKAGGAFLPLDPTYPRERLAFMLADAQVKILLTHARLVNSLQLPEFQNAGLQIISLDVDWPVIGKQPDHNISIEMTGDELAYVIYTSGSTGKPKGVMISHAVIANHCRDIVWRYGICQDDHILQFASINFDAALEEVFMALIIGAQLVIRDNEIWTAPEYHQVILEYAVSVIEATPAYWRQWVSYLADTDRPADLMFRQESHVRLVILGGDVLPLESVNLWRQTALGNVRLLNTYGPTETTITATTFTVPLPAEETDVFNDNQRAAVFGRIPIGRPHPRRSAYILDKFGNPTPIGVPGELYLGGAYLARGYLDRPDLTEEKFIPDPFAGEWREQVDLPPELPFRRAETSPQPAITQHRLYRTGDLTRFLPDGNIDFLGRVDQQVKLRGFRIELGEIEVSLLQHPRVKDAVVLLHEHRDHPPGEKLLVAYVTQKEDATGEQTPLTVLDLRTHLKNILPDYMLPAIFMILEAMPLTPNGKINRQALPHPDAAPELLFRQARTASTYQPPRTPVEQILVRIWEQALGLEKVGIHDNFFELGGDSILSIQVIAKVNQAGLLLTPRQMFEAQTIAQLAVLAGTARAVQAEQGLVTGNFPLTPIQRWFFAQNYPESWYWNQALLFEVKSTRPDASGATVPPGTNVPPGMDQAVLLEAFRHLLRHHDVLRTRFLRTQDTHQPGTIVSPEEWQASIALPEELHLDEQGWISWVDLKEFDEASIAAEIEKHAIVAQASLNLEAGHLVNIVYFDTGPGRVDRLLIVIHHLVIDGVSWRILLEDLFSIFQQLTRGEEVQLTSKTTSYRNWAEQLKSYAHHPQVDAELSYWEEVSRDPALLIPVSELLYREDPYGMNDEASARVLNIAFTKEETTALLQEVPPVYGTEINDVLLTALLQSYAEWSGYQTELSFRREPVRLLVALEGHGREDILSAVDLSRTVGWFTSNYPLCLEIRGELGPGEALKAVKEQIRRVPRNGIGYGLLRYIRQAPQLIGQAWPEVSFNYLGQVDRLLVDQDSAGAELLFRPAKESIGPSHSLNNPRQSLIDINGGIAGGRLSLDWTYSAKLHSQASIASWAGLYQESIRAIIAHCRSPQAGGYTPSDFPLAGVDQAKLDQMLKKINKRGKS